MGKLDDGGTQTEFAKLGGCPENSPDNGPAPEKQTRIAKKIDECFQNFVLAANS